VDDESEKSLQKAGPSYVLGDREYSNIVKDLANPSVIEHILSHTRAEAVAYIGKLLGSGVPRLIVAGPKVAFTASAIEALTDLWEEISAFIKAGKIPKNLSDRQSGYETWVELLQEIDSNPIDRDRLKAMKAMFLAANSTNATDGESIVAYQLFQIAKKLTSGELLLLKVVYRAYKAKSWPANATSSNISYWRTRMAQDLGHGLAGLIRQQERALADHNLITSVVMSGQLETIVGDPSRISDLGIKFCENIEQYQIEVESLESSRDSAE
jgi:hypothetical protein